MGVHESRARQNQLVFREVNQRIADITRGQHEGNSEFLCECGEASCISVIDLSLAEYEEARSQQDVFIAAPGHCVEGVDRLVESRDGFDILVQS
jgi:hypothetical protein